VGQFLATTQTSHQAVLDLKQVTNLSIRGRDSDLAAEDPAGRVAPGQRSGNLRRQLRHGGAGIQGSTRGQTIYVDGINGGDGGGSGGGGTTSAARRTSTRSRK
jgi:hypothetical protein